MPEAEPGRSGCAVASGVFLVLFGVLLLARNLTELRLGDYTREALALFSDYWPVVLIAWGLYKIYRRFWGAEPSRVSFLEVLMLVLLVSVGLAVGMAERAVDRLAGSELRDELAAVLGPEVLGPIHRFEDEESFELPRGGSLAVENLSGGLRVVGAAGSDMQVHLEKEVRGLPEHEARRLAEGIRFDIREGTGRLVGTGEERMRVDVELRLPRGTKLTARAPNGPIEIVGLAAPVAVSARDEDVLVERLDGPLEVTTSHGDVRLARVSGDVTVESRHGSVRARNLGGRLRAEMARGDFSGEDILGDVVVETRHGSVRAARVGGNVDVDAEHSGVELEDVSGGVRVSTSHGPLFVRGVGESLRVEARNAPLEAREIQGDVTIENRLKPVRVIGVGGSLTMRSPDGSVLVERASGPVSIEGTNERIRVDGFRSSLLARTTHGSVEAATDRLGGEVLLETTYGDIEIAVPEDASIRLAAASRNGDLISELPGLELVLSTENGGRIWRGNRGDGVAVRLKSTHGDIRLLSEKP